MAEQAEHELDYNTAPPPRTDWSPWIVFGCGVAAAGLFFIPLLPGLVGWLTANRFFREEDRPDRPGRNRARAGWWLSLASMPVSLLGFATVIAHPHHHRPAANIIKCGSNLRALGQSIRMYAVDDPGRFFPPNLEIAWRDTDLWPEAFVCPISDLDLPAPGDSIVAGTNCDYVYLAACLTDYAPASAVLAYERPGNHKNGGSVLYGDGSIYFKSNAELQAIEKLAGMLQPGEIIDTATTQPTRTKAKPSMLQQ